MVRRSVSN